MQIGTEGLTRVQLIVDLLLHLLVRRVRLHPDTRLGRYLLQKHGPRQDVPQMTRLERLKSALAFFLWGVVCGGLFVALGVMLPALGISRDSAAVFVGVWFLGIFTLMGIGGGLYLLVRALV